MDHEMDLMQRTRAQLILDHPWYGSLALKLRLEATEAVERADVDGVTLRYNPTYFASLTPAERQGLLAHEVEHCALGHMWRIGARDFELSNIAADHVVNLDLKAAGFQIPTPHVCDVRFTNMSFEKIYAVLSDEKSKQEDKKQNEKNPNPSQSGEQNPKSTQDPSSSGSNPSSGKSTGTKSGPSDNQNSGMTSDDGPEAGDGNPNDTQSKNSGSGKPTVDPSKAAYKQTSSQETGEETPSNPANWGSFSAPPPATDEEVRDGSPKSVDDLAYEWEKAVETASMVASKAGDMPGSLLRTIVESKTKREDLTDVLQRHLTSKGLYSFASPNRRMLSRDIRMPGRVRSSIEEVFIWVDTSGSIGQRMLTFFAEKTNEVLLMDSPPERIYVGYCDARVHAVDEFTDGQIEFNPRGGGGTMFGPMFSYMEENDIRPDLVIILTDLEGGDNHRLVDQDYPVVWVTPIQCRIEPPMGEVVRVDPYAVQ